MYRKFKLTRVMARPVLGVMLGFFVLVFGALASVAAVEHALHHNASSHSASCAICSFANGQVETAEGPCISVPPAASFALAPLSINGFFPQDLPFLLPSGRAPPVLAVVS